MSPKKVASLWPAEPIEPGKKHGTGRPTGRPTKPVTGAHCLLCGRSYSKCECVCKFCGEKLWGLGQWGEWKRHYCSGASITDKIRKEALERRRQYDQEKP